MPIKPKPLPVNDPLLDALRSICSKAVEYPGGLCEALKSTDTATWLRASSRLHELAAGLNEIVTKDSRFPGDVVLRMSSGSGWSTFYPNSVGQKLIERLLEQDSPENAIQWLIKILRTSNADGQMIALVRGVQVKEAINITSRLRLVPLADLPDSPQKRQATGIHLGWRPTIAPMFDMEPPSAALVISYAAHPFLFNESVTFLDPSIADSDLVADAILAMTIVGPRLVMQVVSWFSFVDSDLQAAQVGTSFGSRIVEVIPNQWLDTFPTLDPAMAQRATEAFLLHKGSAKGKLRIALTRIRLALSRHSVGDKAVEIAIAFEALLEDGGHSEMTHKIKTRAARLIGGSEKERERTAAIVVRMYDVRSTLVHTGQVNPSKRYSISNDEPKVSAEVIVAFAIDICADLVWKILQRKDGNIPKWSSFDILG